MSSDIINLSECPEHLTTLAEWHHQQWSHLAPKYSLEQRIEIMQQHLNEQALPTTLVLVADHQVLGSASLVEQDMDTHPELTPWLASVYVSPAHRQRGLGRRLVEALCLFAKEQGFSKLYLFTEDQQAFYSSMEWELRGTEAYHGNTVITMEKVLNA